MLEDLTPPQYRCGAGACPFVHRLVIDGKPHLIVVGKSGHGKFEAVRNVVAGIKLGWDETFVVIEEDLLSGIGCQAEVTAVGERSSPSALQPTDSAEAVDWDTMYEIHFPHRTDPTSRHVKMIAEGLRDLRSPLRAALAEFEPDHMAASIEQTVRMLWEAREEIEHLQRPIEEAGTADERTGCQASVSETGEAASSPSAPLQTRLPADADLTPEVERELLQVIRERDDAMIYADSLSEAIAGYFGIEIGEHTNLNCPWVTALEFIRSMPRRPTEEAGLPADERTAASS
jgi:hypothetical protein